MSLCIVYFVYTPNLYHRPCYVHACTPFHTTIRRRWDGILSLLVVTFEILNTCTHYDK